MTGGTPTVLATFNYSNGAGPYAGLTLSGSTLYGTTYDGGANGYGTIFSLPVSGGSPTVLASFNGTNGARPYGSLTLNGSTLYGTTKNGGAYQDGTVFAVDLPSVPEPGTLALVCTSSAIGLVGYARRRRRKRRTAADIPATLSFPSRPITSAKAAQRAA